MDIVDKYVADHRYEWEGQTKASKNIRMVQTIIYILMCICSLGVVFLIRIIITEGVKHALWEVEDARHELRYQAYKDLPEETK